MWNWLFATQPGAPDPSKLRPKSQRRPDGADSKAADGEEDEEEEEEEEKGVGEFRLVLRQMGPWLTSFLFHLALVIIALFLVWIFIDDTEEDETIIPSARLSDNPGGLSQSPDVELQASQQQRKVQATDTATEESVEKLTSNTSSKLSMLGVSGGGGGGKLAPFGTTTGTGTGISAGFFGTGGNARAIIYIIDASGSMVDTMPFVVAELKRSVSGLSAKQKFNVIFFEDGVAKEVPVPNKGWKVADGIAKKQVADWVDLEQGNITPRGRTDPTQAVRLAMQYQPELVFLLSDNITGKGRYEINRSELLQFFKESDVKGKIAINTIQFLSPDPLNTMRDIAKQHNGIPKFITEEDLGISHR